MFGRHCLKCHFRQGETEAYKSFFESNGVQVVNQAYSNNSVTPNATHVISKISLTSGEGFDAIVSGLCFLKFAYVEACIKANKILTNFSDFEFGKYWLIPYPKMTLSEDFAAITGFKEGQIYDVGKKLGAYIEENKLQDPKVGGYFRCDEKLKKIFGCPRFKYLGMYKHLSKHSHMR